MLDVIAIGATDVGKARDKNEDHLLVDNDSELYIVSDGMGGHAAGERASRLAVETASEGMERHRHVFDRVIAGEEDARSVVAIAEEAVQEACGRVYDAACHEQGCAGMGCTLTLIQMLGNKAVMAHVGDSRLYLLRGGTVAQLTTDHTFAAELIRAGAVKAGEVGARLSHVLTRAIGSQATVAVETLLLDVMAGDRYLLCSDGLSQYATDAMLEVELAGDLESVPDNLVEIANAAGGSDNITAIVIEASSGAPQRPSAAAVVGELQVRFDTLQSVFLFEDLPLRHVQRLLNACEVLTFDSGEVIAREGDSYDRMLVVLEGTLGLSRGPTRIGEITPGDCVGETLLLAKRECRSTVTALERCSALALSRAKFWDLIHRRPWLGVSLLERLGRRSDDAFERAHRRLRDLDDPEEIHRVLGGSEM